MTISKETLGELQKLVDAFDTAFAAWSDVNQQNRQWWADRDGAYELLRIEEGHILLLADEAAAKRVADAFRRVMAFDANKCPYENPYRKASEDMRKARNAVLEFVSVNMLREVL